MDPQTGEFLRNAGNVVLGWVLGVGSTSFVDWRRNRKHTRAVKVAIARELREIAYRMVTLVYKLGGRQGLVNRELLQWMQPQIERYAGPNPKDGLAASVAHLLNQSNDQLEALTANLQATTPPSFVPVEEATYTTLAVGNLHDQSPDYSVRVLDILAHLRMFNATNENGLYATRLTFTPGLSHENHERAVANQTQAEAQMVFRARIIVDKITALEGM